jgi:hypothetical protein
MLSHVMDDDDALHERWAHRQDRLRALLEELGGAGLDFRADLALGRFWWQGRGGRPVVVASTRLLLSFARSDSSVLCGWANPSMPASATVPPIDDIGPRIPNCTEADAWRIAMRIGDAVGAHFIYRAPTAQSSAFLGLWDVCAAREDEEPFAARSPWPHVRYVLEAIVSAFDEGRDIGALARGHGRTFAEDRLRRGTPLEAPLRAIGESLASIADSPREAQRMAIAALAAQVARYEAQ